jgi:putative aldouronate transport system substrate-binding protein
MNKRFISMALVLFLALSLLAGCAGDSNEKPDPTQAATQQPNQTQTPEETEEPGPDYGDTGGLKLPITEENIEVTWMTSHPNVEWNDTPFIKELQKRTGIKLIIQDVPSDAYQEKVNTSLASKDMPNMMNVNLATANTYGEQGAFIPLNQHLDLIPNFKSVIVDNPENDWYLKSYSTEAGNVYGWPIMDLQRRVNHLYMYREDIFEKNGLEVWEAGDTEGFYQTLKKLKEIYPDSVPMSSKMLNNFWAQQQPGWGLSYASMSFDHDTRTWSYARTTPQFKEMLDFFQKLYQEGLLDPELFTITNNDWVAKMAAPETSFVTFDWISRMDLFRIQVGETNPEYELSPAPPIGPAGVHFPLPTLGYYGVVVSNITDNKLEALQLVDYLFSPSGATLNTIGVEGEWFNFDENGKPVYTDPELTSLEKIDINNLAEKYGLWNQSIYVRTDRRSLYHSLTEKEQAANDIIVNNDLFRPADPILRFSDAVLERNGEIITNLDTKAYEFATNYLLNGNYGEAEWEKWVNDAKALGLEEIEQNHNDAQKAYDAE